MYLRAVQDDDFMLMKVIIIDYFNGFGRSCGGDIFAAVIEIYQMLSKLFGLLLFLAKKKLHGNAGHFQSAGGIYTRAENKSYMIDANIFTTQPG
ncbi:hypothetical protein SDC9_190964 [bioreactor metagenome]|uniref:Uncharacterized protein n=1 Tax=bioreactor metagenome TaxID=1076179 RepID=A0A645HWH5_9ZZZZ